MAHEIRKPINAVRTNLQTLRRLAYPAHGEDPSSISATIAAANREIERLEGLMRIMLGYALPEKPTDERIDVRSELEATLSFIKPVIDRVGSCVRCRLAPTPLYVHLDRNRFRQIVLNLVANAAEAAGAEGQIDVTLTRSGRGRVEVVVSDNGPGVPPEERQRIFEPFYSTKPQGTGLGLALVKRFVDEARGTVTCEANARTGARFRIDFPEIAGETASLPLTR
jgi:signal transduction histidine kinase